MKFFTKSINKSGALILTLLLCLFTGTAFGQEEITSFTGETLGTSDSKTEWTGHGVQWQKTAKPYYKVPSTASIVSPEIDFTAYTDVKVTANIRTYGKTKKKLSVYLGDTKLGEIAPSSNKLNDVEISINPTEKGQLTFKGDDFTDNLCVGVYSITITGTQTGPGNKYQDISDKLTIDDFYNTTSEAYALTTDIVKASGVVYAGSVQKGTSGGIGIRERKRDAGIYVTANPNGYRLKGIILEWADSQYADDRAVSIYGKNDAYDSVQVLFDETRRGTLIKAITGKPSDVTTARTFEADYRFAGLVSDNGTPQFKSITFVWETAPVPTTGSFTIGEDKLATFYSQFAYTMPQGVTGGVVTYDNTKAGTITSVDVDYRYPAGSVVPAKTSLLLKGEPATYDYDITESELAAPTDNALHGANDVDDDNYTYVDLGSGVNVAYYTLSHDKETGKNVGFYFYEPDGAKTKYVAPHAYLALPYAAGTKAAPYLSLGNVDNGTTGISGNVADVKAGSRVYTITGACVGNSLKGLKKGIYIVNGKKVVL